MTGELDGCCNPPPTVVCKAAIRAESWEGVGQGTGERVRTVRE